MCKGAENKLISVPVHYTLDSDIAMVDCSNSGAWRLSVAGPVMIYEDHRRYQSRLVAIGLLLQSRDALCAVMRVIQLYNSK